MSPTTKGDKEHRRHSRERKQKKHNRERTHKREGSKKKGKHDENQIPSSSLLEEERKDRREHSDDGVTSGDNERSNRRHRHHRSRRSRSKKKHSKKKRRRSSVSTDDDTNVSSSGSSDGGESPPERRRSNKHKKKSKRKTSEREHHRAGRSRMGLDLKEEEIPKKSLQFASTLQSLLQYDAALSKELPYLLIRMASGECLNLKSMADAHASMALTEVFKSMGCALNSANCWEWKGGEELKGLLNSDQKSLLLVKMARCLLDGVGVTMEAVLDFENKQHRNNQVIATNEIIAQGKVCSKANTATTTKSITTTIEEKEDTQTGEISSLTTMLLEKFNKCHNNIGNSGKSSLAKEVFDIVTLILDGESICLDGIPNDSLRKSLETLFLAVGLIKEEMMEEEEEDHQEKNKEEEKQYDNDTMKKSDEIKRVDGDSITYGYTLPEEITSEGYVSVKMKLDAVIGACKHSHQNTIQSRSKTRVLGPAMPSSFNSPPNTGSTIISREESDTDDDGPAPLGSETIDRRIGSIKTNKSQLVPATSRNGKGGQKIPHDRTDEDGRESWMLEPGEHDFLKGIMASGTIQNRKFQNVKTQGRYDKSSASMESAPIDPKVQLEVNNILKAQAQARGPSLVQQHRENKIKKDAEASENGTEWGWSREKDLDRDRRVDKQNLSLVLGGASQQLKEKFQGTFSKD